MIARIAVKPGNLAGIGCGSLVRTVRTSPAYHGTDSNPLEGRVTQVSHLAPLQLRFVTPPPFSTVASGLAQPGQPSPRGMFFIITVQAISRNSTFPVREGATASPGSIPGPNPNFPDFVFIFSEDLVTPTGGVIPAGTNLAPLFQFAGAEIPNDGGVAVTFTWLVGGSVNPEVQQLNMAARMKDVSGNTVDRSLAVLIRGGISGDDLTPNPPPPPPV